MAKAAVLGDYLIEQLQLLSNKHAQITAVRGKGLLCAFDLPTDKDRDALVAKAMEEKMLILGCGERSIRFRPHLTASKAEIDKAIAIVDKLLS